MIRKVVPFVSILFLAIGTWRCAQMPRSASAAGSVDSQDRRRLPIADAEARGETEIDPARAVMPEPREWGAPEGAPNVLVVLLDDLGFGGPATFGGSIRMPTLDRLASQGLRYTRFHTVALCAPTRVALKQGRNHHMANMGSIPEIATGFQGNMARVPNYAAPIAEVLRLNGYNTAAFGKWHATLGGETTASGPQDRWPTRQGFEKFYGFIGAEENMFNPSVHDGVTLVDVPDNPDYHFQEDMTQQAIAWVREQQSMTPGKPFFMYYAPPGVHAPHHVHEEWSNKYKGAFDRGWDAEREAVLQRQIELGVVPAGTRLADKPESIPDWDSLTDDQRRIYARQAEVFAGFTEYTDHLVGDLLDAIDGLGELDNTLVVYITGDNGTSSEGNQTGNWNWGNMLNGRQEELAEQLQYYDRWGGPETYPHMAVGWAIAFDAPFAYTKQVSGDFGGTRNGTVIHWPKGIESKGEVRTQFAHVIDVAPTILEVAGIPEPTHVNGVEQIPLQGTSLAYSFDDGAAPERHTVQYFEVVGNRGIYMDGWLARVVVKAPWELKKRRLVTDDEGWELFDTRVDFSLAHDVAAEHPERLEAMKKRFEQEAVENHVYPLDDRLLERLLPEVAGRTSLMGDRTSVTLYPGTRSINENALINLKNRSSRITADVMVTDASNNEGVLMAQGSRFGGWSVFIEGGKPAYAYNDLGKVTVVQSDEALTEGSHEIVADFNYEGEGFGNPANVSLSVDGKVVAEARLERTIPSRFSIDEGADVAMDRGTQVLTRNVGRQRHSAYTGVLEQVAIEVR